MKKPMLFLAQLSVAVVVILVWHLFTATHLLGNPAKAKFFCDAGRCGAAHL